MNTSALLFSRDAEEEAGKPWIIRARSINDNINDMHNNALFAHEPLLVASPMLSIEDSRETTTGTIKGVIWSILVVVVYIFRTWPLTIRVANWFSWFGRGHANMEDVFEPFRWSHIACIVTYNPSARACSSFPHIQTLAAIMKAGTVGGGTSVVWEQIFRHARRKVARPPRFQF